MAATAGSSKKFNHGPMERRDAVTGSIHERSIIAPKIGPASAVPAGTACWTFLTSELRDPLGERPLSPIRFREGGRQ